MNETLYFLLYRQLRMKGDVFKLANTLAVPKEVLFAILSQKIVRRTKRDYHGLKRQSPRLLSQWKQGKTLLKLSEERAFSPVLITTFVLRENGATKKEISEYLHNPLQIQNPRLKREILEVLAEEVVYSPEAAVIQRENGKNAEKRIAEWLDRRKLEYITEVEARELHQKTPDFLLKHPFFFRGKQIFWVESKASFGDKVQMRGDYNRQLKHYVGLFGCGLVVYWHGYINDAHAPEPFPFDPMIIIANSQLIGGKGKDASKKEGKGERDPCLNSRESSSTS